MIVKNKKIRVIGLMSGTSLDGLDICLAEISLHNGKINAEQKYFCSYTYPTLLQQNIKRAINGKAVDICHWNFKLGEIWSDYIQDFLNKNNIDKKSIDLIGSHGQTIWHIHKDSTLQIGEPSVISERIGIPVVADFRTRDIVAGGSGAPLVPIIDYYLLKNEHKTRIALNIGGMANFTIIPANVDSIDNVWALDTGPGNVLINIATEMYSNGKMAYDKNGEIAKQGKISHELLEHLLNHPYIKMDMPKSTGREEFGKNYFDKLIKKFNIDHEILPDMIATLTKFTALAIRSNYEQFFINKFPADELIVSGGGAQNPVIMSHLQELFKDCKVYNSEELGIDSDAKEALAFAILAALYVWQIPGNIPNVTGAGKQVILGKLIK